MKGISLRKKILWIFSCALLVVSTVGFVSYSFAKKSQSEDYLQILSELKTDYKTTDKKPTYTATLNTNNEYLNEIAKQLKVIEQKLNEAPSQGNNNSTSTNPSQGEGNSSSTNPSQGNETSTGKDSQTKTKLTKKEVAKLMNERAKTVSEGVCGLLKTLEQGIHNNAYDNPQAVLECVYSVVKDLARIVAGCFGYGAIADAACNILDGIISLFKHGATALSETEKLQYHIDQQFDIVNAKLDEIKNDIEALSLKLDSSVSSIISANISVAQVQTSFESVCAFYLENTGNFSYKRFKNYFSNSLQNDATDSYAYMALINDAVRKNASDDRINKLYDNYFNALSENMPKFESYLMGGGLPGNKSIVKQYYDYLSFYRDDNTVVPSGMNPESMAIDFALDLYNTYSEACDSFASCYTHQAMNLILKAYDDAEGSSEKFEQNLNNYDVKDLTYDMLFNNSEEYASRKEKIKTYIVDDLAYVLGIGESYISVDKDGYVNDNYCYFSGVDHINVAENQTIYTNLFSETLDYLFGLDSDDFHYYFGTKDNCSEITDLNKIGVIEASKIVNKTNPYVELKYKDKTIYRTYFVYESATEFSGGDGSYDHPYLISNEKQFLLMMRTNEMNSCYKLISNINMNKLTSEELSYVRSIGCDDAFNGVFDGNGYSISNITINSRNEEYKIDTQRTGLFNRIGNKGVVKNLTLKKLVVNSQKTDDKVEPNKDNTFFYVGGIAGVNEGTISNCEIAGLTFDVDREKSTDKPSNVYIYVGSVAGLNSGVIKDIDVRYYDDKISSIDVNSKTNCYSEAESSNQNTVYIGGIVGYTYTTINSVSVDGLQISSKAESNADSKDSKAPYATVYVGGIIGNTEDTASGKINKCYSNVDIVKPETPIDNLGSGWEETKNTKSLVGNYFPKFEYLSNDELASDEQINSNKDLYNAICYKIASLNNIYSYTSYKQLADKYSEELNIIGDFASGINLNQITTEAKKALKTYLLKKRLLDEKEVGASYNADYTKTSYSKTKTFWYSIDIEPINNNFVFEIGELFDITKYNVYVNGSKVTPTIISYYGFSSKNEKEISDSRNLVIFFVATIYGKDVLLSKELNAEIEADHIIYSEIGNTCAIYGDDDLSDDYVMSILASNAMKITHYYKSGKIESYTVEHGDFTIHAKDGKSVASHKGNVVVLIKDRNYDILFEAEIDILCKHAVYFEEYVEGTCLEKGYTKIKCQDCGFYIKTNYTNGDHEFEVEEGVSPTCTNCGKTESVRCKHCGLEVKTSEIIPQLKHKYSILSEDKHYCEYCNYIEPHQLILTEETNDEGDLVYRASCASCNYVSEILETNVITSDYLSTPMVYVTSGYYVLRDNKKPRVTVYIEVLNNPGFNSMTFGIRYSEGLKLVNTSTNSKILSDEGTLVLTPAYCGLNISWSSNEGENVTKSGHLIKLEFIVEKAEPEFLVKVVYGLRTKCGFTNSSDKLNIYKYYTLNGVIKKAEHLPGDIDNNDIVDNVDRKKLLEYLQKSVDIPNEMYQYADVNLDGEVNQQDEVAISQYLAGTFGTSLLSPNYHLSLNYNGLDIKNTKLEDSVTVKYYGENSDPNYRPTWASVLGNNAKPEREGYTFLGWYNRIVFKKDKDQLIDLNSLITYDYDQKVQTLYAQWEKNTVTLDFKDGTSKTYTYSLDDDVIELPKATQEYKVNYHLSSKNVNKDVKVTYYRTFLGWYDLDGNKYTKIDLRTPNINELVSTLYPRWKDSFELSKAEELGYEETNVWYTDPNNYTEFDVSKISNLLDEMRLNHETDIDVYVNLKAKEYVVEYDSECVNDGNTTLNVDNLETFKIKTFVTQPKKVFYYWQSASGVKYSELTYDNYRSFLTDGKIKFYANVKELKTYTITIKTPQEGALEGHALSYDTSYIYYLEDNGYFSNEACTNKISNWSFRSYSHYKNYGFYEDSVINNGTSSASSNNNKKIISEGGKILLETLDRNVTCVAMYKPISTNLYFTLTNYVQSRDIISNSYTSSVTAYYGEKLPTITLPRGKYYKYSFTYNGTVYYPNSNGGSSNESWKVFVPSGAVQMDAKLEQVYSNYTYIYSASDWNNFAQNCNNTADGQCRRNAMILNDIVYNSDTAITSINKLASGYIIDGQYHKFEKVIIGKTTASMPASEKSIGLVNYNYGTIKNLNISASTVVFNCKNSNKVKANVKIHIGAIAGTNSGTIESCCVSHTSITGNVYSDHGAANIWKTLDVGGIAGVTTGTIKYLTVSDCIIAATTEVKYDQQNGVARAGGVVGIVATSSSNRLGCCEVKDCIIKATAKATCDKWWNDANQEFAEAGTYAGRMYSTSNYYGCGSSSNTITVYTNKSSSRARKGDAYGYIGDCD